MRCAAINPPCQKPFGLWFYEKQQFAALLFHTDHVDLVLSDKRRTIRIVSQNNLCRTASIKRHADLNIFVQLVDQVISGIEE